MRGPDLPRAARRPGGRLREGALHAHPLPDQTGPRAPGPRGGCRGARRLPRRPEAGPRRRAGCARARSAELADREAGTVARDAGADALGVAQADRDVVEPVGVQVADRAAGGPALGRDDRAPGAGAGREVRRPADRAPVDEGAPDVEASLADADAVAAAHDGWTKIDEAPRLPARDLFDVQAEAESRKGGEARLQPLACVSAAGVDAADAHPRGRVAGRDRRPAERRGRGRGAVRS